MNPIVLFNHHFLAVHDVDARLGGHAVDAVTATPHFRMVMIVFLFIVFAYDLILFSIHFLISFPNTSSA